MKNRCMKFEEWKKILMPSEIEALEDYGHKAKDNICASDVFETIVDWNGGIATAYQINSIIFRVYGVELGGY